MSQDKKLTIRNSTAEFLIFNRQGILDSSNRKKEETQIQMITEDQLKQQAFQWFQDIGWSHVDGADSYPELPDNSKPTKTNL